MSQSLFRGSGVALVTPMTPDGIDFPALEQLIEWHIASGTDALILCATTGEGATLTYAERAEIIERSIRQVNGRVPVIAGAGSGKTRALARRFAYLVNEVGTLPGNILCVTFTNKSAAEISRSYDVHAATDVTGFSFLGHLHEMMGGRLSCRIDASAVPVLPGAWQAADDCLFTAAGQRNRNHTGPFVRFEGVPFAMEEILFDPQTSGGLLLAVAPEDAALLETELKGVGLPAAIVGEITERQDTEILVSYPEYSKPIF